MSTFPLSGFEKIMPWKVIRCPENWSELSPRSPSRLLIHAKENHEPENLLEASHYILSSCDVKPLLYHFEARCHLMQVIFP